MVSNFACQTSEMKQWRRKSKKKNNLLDYGFQQAESAQPSTKRRQKRVDTNANEISEADLVRRRVLDGQVRHHSLLRNRRPGLTKFASGAT